MKHCMMVICDRGLRIPSINKFNIDGCSFFQNDFAICAMRNYLVSLAKHETANEKSLVPQDIK